MNSRKTVLFISDFFVCNMIFSVGGVYFLKPDGFPHIIIIFFCSALIVNPLFMGLCLIHNLYAGCTAILIGPLRKVVLQTLYLNRT